MYICIYFLERGILYPYEVKLDPVEFGQIFNSKRFPKNIPDTASFLSNFK